VLVSFNVHVTPGLAIKYTMDILNINSRHMTFP